MLEKSMKSIITSDNSESYNKKLKLKELSYNLCKCYSPYWLTEIISVFFSFFHLISLTLNVSFDDIWKLSFASKLNSLLRFTTLFTILSYNNTLYLTLFYWSVTLLIFIVILIVLCWVFKPKSDSLLICVLVNILSCLVYPFYLPWLWLWLSLNSCSNGFNVYLEDSKCWENLNFLHAIVGYIAAIVLFVISWCTITTLYSIDLFRVNAVTKKTTSICDIQFMFVKTILGIVYTITFKNRTLGDEIQWVLTVLYVILSGTILYKYLSIRPYLNTILSNCFLLCSSLFFWLNLALFLSKALEYTSFNGGIPLFLVGSLWVIWILFFKEVDQSMQITFCDKTENETLLQFIYLINWISKAKIKRSAQLLLEGYISLYEKTCDEYDCPWKIFLKKENKFSSDNLTLLYQHIEILYLKAINIHSGTKLRLQYSIFLLTYLNKKKCAWTEWIMWENGKCTIEEEFLIYKYIRYIENHDELDKSMTGNKTVQTIMYKKEWNLFKQNIKKVSLFYSDFWSCLLWSNQDNKDSLVKLNGIGKKIINGGKEIKCSLDYWNSLRCNDKETLALYYDFQANIVNNKDKANELKKKILELEHEDERNHIGKGLENLNLDILTTNALSANDVNQYIIVSSQAENFGVIMNMSLSLCSLLGYSKKDIVGIKYECWLPCIYSKEHTEIMSTKVSEYKREWFQSDNTKSNEFVQKDKYVFFVTRSKYWWKLHWKVGIVSNEYNDCFFVSKVIDSKQIDKEINVLINTEFVIQNFTTNAIQYLGFTSQMMNNNTSITDYIKEFSEEFLKKFSENSCVQSHKTAIAIKKEIQETWFNSKEVIVTIRKREGKSNTVTLNEHNQFKWEISKEKINDILIGYVYTFTVLPKTSWKRKTIVSDLLTETLVNNTLTSTSDMDKELLSGDFVPKNEFTFHLNTGKMAFTKTGNNPSPMSEKEYWKNLAMQKINQKEGYIIECTEEDDSDSSDKDGSDYSSGSKNNENTSYDDDDNDISKSSTMKNMKKDSDKIVYGNSENNYYHVDMTKIKYSIYDFKLQIVLEEKGYPKVSEVELKKYENNKKEKKPKPEEDKPGASNTKAVDNEVNTPEQISLEIDQKVIIQKQIESALLRQESQPTIINWLFASFIAIVLITSLGIAFLVIFHISLMNLAENLLIIQHSYDWLVYLWYGYYYVIELNLYNYKRYLNKPDNWDESVEEIRSILLDYYNTSSYGLNYITTTFTHFSKNISSWMKWENIEVRVIDENYDVLSYNMRLTSAYNEWITALFNVAIGPMKDMIPTNKNNYYYKYNAGNSVYAGVAMQNNYFIDNIMQNAHEYIIISITVVCASVVVLSICYLIITRTYQKVAVKKESYLEVFYDIEKSVLTVLLESCENFNQKMKGDKFSETQSYGLGALVRNKGEVFDKNSQSQGCFEEDEIIDWMKQEIGGIEKRKTIKNEKYWSKETKAIKWYIAGLMGGILWYWVVIFVWFIQYLNTLKSRIIVFQKFYDLNILYLQYHNSLRNYIFDSNSSLYNQKASAFITDIIPEIYESRSERKEFVTNDIDKYPVDFAKMFNSISESNICHYGEERVFKNRKYTCETFLDGSAQFGLEYMVSTYIMVIIYLKNLNLLSEENKYPSFNYNLTLIGTPSEDYTIPTEDNYTFNGVWDSLAYQEAIINYDDNHQINVLNSERTIEMNNFFLYFWIPTFEDLNTNMKTYMNTIIKNKKSLFLWLSVAFIILNLLWFMLLFLPFINNLRQIIYKTKNMLSIIPRQILWNIPNICSLWNINNNINMGGKLKVTTESSVDIINYTINNTNSPVGTP